MGPDGLVRHGSRRLCLRGGMDVNRRYSGPGSRPARGRASWNPCGRDRCRFGCRNAIPGHGSGFGARFGFHHDGFYRYIGWDSIHPKLCGFGEQALGHQYEHRNRYRAAHRYYRLGFGLQRTGLAGESLGSQRGECGQFHDSCRFGHRCQCQHGFLRFFHYRSEPAGHHGPV